MLKYGSCVTSGTAGGRSGGNFSSAARVDWPTGKSGLAASASQGVFWKILFTAVEPFQRS